MDTTEGMPFVLHPPRRRRWTRAEFGRASDLGLFGPDERLELIEGDIVEKVTQNPPHSVCTDLVETYARKAFPECYVRGQKPLALGDVNEPEPDVAVVTGSIRDYLNAHPTTALLVVEVAESSLAQDRGTKAGVYARAGIEEYWIVNLRDRLLEVHREPGPMSEQPVGFFYRSVTCLTEDEMVAPLHAREAVVKVSELLP